MSQDVTLLEYVYSDVFGWSSFGGSTLLAQLMKTFAFTFGKAISEPSLRHAMLALAAALNPSDQINSDLAYVYCRKAHRTLLTKNFATVREADLFAAFVLAMVSCVLGEFSAFRTHLGDFMNLAQLNRRGSTNENRHALSMFWPLARDLLLESSRTFLRASDLVLEFHNNCRRFLGPQSLLTRVNYLTTFYGDDPEHDCAFLQASWQYSIVLRVCLRKTLSRQFQGYQSTDTITASVVSELKSDLSSSQSNAIVARICAELGFGPQLPFNYDLSAYALLLHQFCHLLITLLEATTLVEGARSLAARRHALTILDLLRPEWMHDNGKSDSIFPRNISPFVIPRILRIVGLALNEEDFKGGNFTSKSSLLINSCKTHFQ